MIHTGDTLIHSGDEHSNDCNCTKIDMQRYLFYPPRCKLLLLLWFTSTDWIVSLGPRQHGITHARIYHTHEILLELDRLNLRLFCWRFNRCTFIFQVDGKSRDQRIPIKYVYVRRLAKTEWISRIEPMLYIVMWLLAACEWVGTSEGA